MTALEQDAALVALLRSDANTLPWNETASEVAFWGDAVTVWDQVTSTDALLRDPRLADELARAHDEVRAWRREGLRFVSVQDSAYPRRLLDIRETPPFLFAAGELRAEDPGMSVVGSRQCSEQGRRIATAAAQLLVTRGLSVIAGLASGIDSVAHRAALDAGGRTVAFVGTGIRKYYPASNRELQDEIARRGLLLSQFWPDATPAKHTFPMRNATMSGYGLATIVVEAGEHSGTRIQARKAVEHGRPVILTDLVAERTQWGAALVGRPGVHVARGARHLERIVDEVVASQGDFDRALSVIAASPVA